MTADTAEFDETIALRALLEADARLVGRVGVGNAPTTTDGSVLSPPYVVITGDDQSEDQERFACPVPTRQPSWAVHAVGESELAAVAVLGWVDGLLRPRGRGVTPVVAGRRTKPIRRLERPGNAEDNAVQPSVWYAIAVYAFESSPTNL